VAQSRRVLRRLTRVIALLGALVAAATAVGAAAHTETLPPYIRLKGIGFEIYSNRAWHGVNGTTGVREFGPRPVRYGSKDRSYRIGTATCASGQKLSFARTVELLGPPSYVRFNVEVGASIASTAFFVNGRPASRALGTSLPDLKPGQLHLFRPGVDELELVITLASTPTPCKGFPHPGFWFDIGGGFATDLGVGAPKASEKITYFKADEGRTVVTKIRVFNNGPDLIPETNFQVSSSGRGFCVDTKPDGSCDIGDYQFTMLATNALGGISCTTDRFLIATCPIENLKPGETRIATVIVRFKTDPTTPGWAEESTGLTWTARAADGGPGELDYDNNQGQVSYVFCSQRSTSEGCRAAK
jgi:hypothetical protein